ncbi:hypothetical protein TRFO_10001 [Tritrichomonas foetus]|uniref:Leucine Rich Repeat family protein n=1 Tax=Tritrichomonas foetus TaxID=1144522 RepID=A0A1J4JDI6_9EUKA|nr:hypothetical protein TRFO_10001 [Tritrichomonas foetus]|eukprot:OHS96351.1 hypothetical protein TRFO_10001 [Tritrichomonas foetus]
MLTEIVLCPDGRKPQKIDFDQLFNYNGKKKLKKIKSFSAKADTSDMTLSFLGDYLPGLQTLRLDNSVFSCLRDLSTHLPNLKILSLTYCGLSSIDGIATISGRIQELYLAHNFIDDVSPLIGYNTLKILDLESNLIGYVEDVALLKCCTGLRSLTLTGTGATEHPEYRSEIKRLIPRLQILDGVKFGEEEKQQEQQNQVQQEPEKPQIAELSEDVPTLDPKVPIPALKSVSSEGNIPPIPPVSEPAQPPKASPVRKNRMVVKTKILQPRAPRIWHNVGPIRL